jgi:hypothetical protein
MKLIYEMVIPVGMGILILAALFLMKGVIGFVIGLPLYMLLGAAVIPGVIIMILLNILLKIRRYGKEGFVFMQARNDGLPVLIDVEIGTGNAEFVVGEKANPKDITFKDESSGVKIDPSLVSAHAEPLRFPNGLDIFGYAYHNWLPQTTRNHLAFKAIIEYRHRDEEMKQLDFLPDKEFIELISKPEHFLDADLKTKVGKYFKTKKDDAGAPKYYRQYSEMVGNEVKWFEEEIEIPEIIRLINKAKGDITNLPIATGYFSMNEAFKYNSVAYSAQHLSQLKILIEKLADEKYAKLMNWMQYGIVGLMLLCGTGVCIYLASMAFNKAG